MDDFVEIGVFAPGTGESLGVAALPAAAPHPQRQANDPHHRSRGARARRHRSFEQADRPRARGQRRRGEGSERRCFVTRTSLDSRWRDPEQPERGDRDRFHVAINMDGNGRWALAARSTQGGGPCRRSDGGPTNGGVRAGVRDHHSDALRVFLRQLAPSARRSGQPDVSVPEVPGLRVRPPDGQWCALQRHRASGPDPGFPQTQHRARRGANERRRPLSTSGLRWTIRPAMRCWRRPAVSPQGIPPTREAFERAMYESIHAPSGTRDVDLLIRTGGEQRLSDFLLWESAYAELYFTDVLWPDFTEADLASAVQAFAVRDRRYGGIQQCRTMSAERHAALPRLHPRRHSGLRA